MYRVLIADDEGIMRDALKAVIEKNFGNECELAFARTGRSVVELAESFRPDIVFMDIQMPGINGIQAIREINKFCTSIRYFIITAYDTFDYAREAINLGVMDYLTKPVKRAAVVSCLERAMKEIDEERRKRSDDLKIQEKLETVIPIVENGFVNSMILQEDHSGDLSYYRSLLDLQQEYAFVMLIQFGQLDEEGILTAPVGLSVRAQAFYPELRSVCKEFFPCIVGPVMTSRVVLCIPREEKTLEYAERIRIIEQTRNLLRKLGKRFDARFRAGIGKIYPIEELRLSYTEAYRALSRSTSGVAHVDDLTAQGESAGNYPDALERKLLSQVGRGDWEGARDSAEELFDWMVRSCYEDREDIQLKVLELVILAERDSFFDGKTGSGDFHARKGYLSAVLSCRDYSDLRRWFLERLEAVCQTNRTHRREQTDSVITRARAYIDQNFARDLSLDDVSRIVDISPYYFSKLFKEKSGENFIEYLTRVRIAHAKELLKNPELSIKEICLMSGYSDPNYFSRIFKKQEDLTPSEYRERL